MFRSPSPTGDESRLRPLHLDCHGGDFLGGLPEIDAAFCSRLAQETGAVVISTTYRYAPKHHFPAAINDINAVAVHLRQHGKYRYDADTSLLSVSGFSEGANLVLATALSLSDGAVKAAVTFYMIMDLRLKPEEKPKPVGFSGNNPFRFLYPLFDSYPAPVRTENIDNPCLSPIIAKIERLPGNILMVISGIDLVVHEQMTFIQTLKEEGQRDPKEAGRRFEMLYDEKAFHGHLERMVVVQNIQGEEIRLTPSVPSSITPQEKKDRAIGAGVKFIKDTHQKHGWNWQ